MKQFPTKSVQRWLDLNLQAGQPIFAKDQMSEMKQQSDERMTYYYA